MNEMVVSARLGRASETAEACRPHGARASERVRDNAIGTAGQRK